MKNNSEYRTISEVADLLQEPPSMLRFWETQFHQLKPLKRLGGRRYYSPQDVKLLSYIRDSLHNEGLTIKGLQRRFKMQELKENPQDMNLFVIQELTEIKESLQKVIND